MYNMADQHNQIIQIVAHTILRRRLIVLAILNMKNKRRYNKKRKCWMSNFLSQRNTNGAYYVTVPKLRDFNSFENYCRMNRSQFEELLTLIGPKITKITAIREPIEPAQRLLLTLRSVTCVYVNILSFLF